MIFRMYCLISKYVGIFQLPLLLISILISLGLHSILCMISVPLKLLRCVLWSRMSSILVNAPYELEKNIYFPIVGWSSLWMSLVSTWLMAVSSFFFFFCFLDQHLLIEEFVEVFNYNIELIYFSCNLSLFTSYICCSFVRYILWTIKPWEIDHFIIISDNFLCFD
jgi:hypothetical protein